MASTRTYLDYLNDKIEIAPANSQEEFEAARLIGSLMEEHGLETRIQEFDAPAAADVPHAIMYMILFVGMLLSGVLGTPASPIGFVLVLAVVVVLALRFGGRDLLAGMGPRARSQNVVGIHRASGPLVMKGNRPIVVVAHYDTPNESLLTRPQLVRFRATLMRASLWSVAVVAVCALLQMVGFVPGVARHIFWVIGVLAGVPMLLLGVDVFYTRFAECTLGANDNKSSVAAMLGVMDVVLPGDDDAKRYGAGRPATVAPEAGAAEGTDGALSAAGETAVRKPAVELDARGASEGAEAAGPHAGGVAAGAAAAFGKVRSGVLGFMKRGDNDVPQIKRGGAYEDALEGDDACSLSEEDSDEVVEAPSVVVVGRGSEAAPEPALDPVVEKRVSDGLDVAIPEVEPVSAQEPLTEASEVFEPAQVEFVQDESEQEVPVEERAVRRGADFIESLHMLPENCEIVYQVPPRPQIDLSTLPQIPEIPTFSPEDFMTELDIPAEESADVEDALHTGYVPSFFAQEMPKVPAAPRESIVDEPVFEPASADEQLPADSYGGEHADAQDGEWDNPYLHEEVLPIPTAQELLDSVPVADYEVIDEGSNGHGEDGLSVQQTVSVPALTDDVIEDARNDASVSENAFEYDESETHDESSEAPLSFGERVKGIFDGLRERLAGGRDGESDGIFGGERDGRRRLSPSSTLADEISTDIFVTAGDADDEVKVVEGEEDDEPVLPKDVSGLDTLSEDGTVARPAEVRVEPEAIDDPMWGESEFEPSSSNIARRAVLFDLPDPSVLARDPFDTDTTGGGLRVDMVADADEQAEGAGLPEDGQDAELEGDAEPSRTDSWKGGATNRVDLREGDGEPTVDEMEDMRSAILTMSDEELLAHDIYFVALGGSKLNHAGMREFLAEHRKSIRGAFLINLDSVGAGDLTVLTVEGSNNTRRADRRLVRLVSGVAKDLHIRLAHKKYDWAETDATPAMQAAVRSVTIMGMSESDAPAFSGSSDDVPQNVDAAQVVDVTELVAEVIRRA